MTQRDINLEDKKQKEYNRQVTEMREKYPEVPECIFDIEASDEMAMLYAEWQYQTENQDIIVSNYL